MYLSSHLDVLNGIEVYFDSCPAPVEPDCGEIAGVGDDGWTLHDVRSDPRVVNGSENRINS